MIKEAILHIPDSRFCFAEDKNTAVIRLRIAAADKFDGIELIYGSKYTYYLTRERAPLAESYNDGTFVYYEVRLKLEDTRLVYIFELKSEGGTFYFSEDGVTESYDFEFAYYNCFQLPYINLIDVHEVVPWMRQTVFYQIFVDRFCRGQEGGGDFINLEWGEKPQRDSFAGGDLRGIIQKLDYIKSLGIGTIYLTPIFCSVSNNKYDIYDYYNVDPHFGTNADFKELMDKAHAKGMRIVLDAVFNHCSELLSQFKDVTENGRRSPYYSWFMIDGDKPDKQKLNYECFASCSYMPRFNTSNPEVQKFLIDIALYWMRGFGIDGWRLDVGDEVSHNFWRHFRESVKNQNKDCVIIGENWHDANIYLQGDQYDGIMNYSLTKACLDYFALSAIGAREMAERLSGIFVRNTNAANFMMLNILDSHDTHRFLTRAGGDRDKLACALSLIFVYPGAAGIFYGTEICTEGGYDPDCRRTFDWDKAEKEGEEGIISEIIKALCTLKARKELMYGDVRFGCYGEILELTRLLEGGAVRLSVNVSGTALPVRSGGKTLLRHNAQDGIILSGGFMIEEVKE